MVTTILKSFDTILFITTTSSSIAVCVMGIGLVAIPISRGIACGLRINIKELHEIIMQRHNKDKKQYQKTNKLFNLLITYTARVYKITYLIKKNMNLYVKVLLEI